MIPPFHHSPASFVDIPRDLITEAGAYFIARRIEQVWADCGHNNVRCTVEPTGYASRSGTMTYGVRSNLVNGLPSDE